jgi:hypothetical protein
LWAKGSGSEVELTLTENCDIPRIEERLAVRSEDILCMSGNLKWLLGVEDLVSLATKKTLDDARVLAPPRSAR